ncbi:MAG: hypothetical protein AABX88_00630 [Nanoarchaeota archaeon]
MGESSNIFSSKMKYDGIFSFSEFYKFCHEWLKEEAGLSISEGKYAEKLSGDAKNIDVEWKGEKKVTDYFKYEVKVVFKIIGLKNVEMMKGGAKIKTNTGSVEVSIKGNLIKDYEGKWEKDAFKKFLRGIYEKWIISSNVEAMENKLVSDCDEFLGQAKAYLDLEGKK